MTDQSEKKHSAFWGVMVIAGTVIGGGMFALPVDPARAWFSQGTFIPIIAWFSMLYSGLLLSEASLNCLAGPSLNTIIKDLIGNTQGIISGTTAVLVLYILTYAHISANGAIISETISINLDYRANPRIVGICTVIFVASVLWIGSLAASRITSLFLGLKIISFVIVSGSFFFQVDYSILCDSTSTTTGTSYFPHIFMALSVCLASLGFHGNVPSLIIYYGKKKGKLIKSMVFGPLLALVICLSRFYYTMGNIPRESSKAIISSGGNIDSLAKSFLGTERYGIIESCLLVFSNLAAASSLFGIMLRLFDYSADLFETDNSHGGRFKIVLLIFLPPALLYLIFPNGFICGTGGAGLCIIIWAVIIPVVLVTKARRKFPNRVFTVWGGNLIPAVVILSGITAILCWFGSIFSVLPKFG